MIVDKKNIVFFSSCTEFWGGSEELWSQAAEILARDGFRIHIFKLSIDFSRPQIKRLVDLGCQVTDLNEYLPGLGRRFLNRFLPYSPYRTLPYYITTQLAKHLHQLNPQLFVVSQGVNFDGLFFIKNCYLQNTPYVIISQKADDALWANDADREWMKDLWNNAEKTFFVSRHNLKSTREQFCVHLDNAEVVRNPFLSKTKTTLPWNFSKNEKIRLACVGRLFLLEKGQDILLKVLADKKWRERDIEVSFFGKGVNRNGLSELADYFQLKNVFFRGHATNIDSIWEEHQALVLPSRAEGLPLVIVEAMMCGRVPIVTNVGGNAEVIEDNVTGFVAASATLDNFDEALERAWQRRAEWGQIGRIAAEHIRKQEFVNPAQVFAEKLISIIEKYILSYNTDFEEVVE